MSGIKALEKLRGLRDEAASKMVDNPRWVCMRAEEIADEIEAEVAERYMELPVDADGVPIHIGDILLKSTGAPKASYGDVVGVSDDSVWFSVKNGWESNWANLTRHYEPDSIERVAMDMRDSISEHVGLAPDEVLAFVERLQRLERAE